MLKNNDYKKKCKEYHIYIEMYDDLMLDLSKYL